MYGIEISNGFIRKDNNMFPYTRGLKVDYKSKYTLIIRIIGNVDIIEIANPHTDLTIKEAMDNLSDWLWKQIKSDKQTNIKL